MPRLKKRYDYIKIYRPDKARFSEGGGSTPEIAIKEAESNFVSEFGGLPNEVYRIYEIVGVTAWYYATLFEIID